MIDWKNPSGPKATPTSYWPMSRFTMHGDVHAVFDIDPPQSLLDKIAEEGDLHHSEDLGILSNTKLKNEFASLSEERRMSQAINVGERSSVSPRTKRKRRRSSRSQDTIRRETQNDQKLKEQFQDSDDAEDEDHHPAGYRKQKRGERMDSLIDLNGEQDARILEALTRIHKMEGAMERMVAMLSQLVDGDVSSENSEGREELAQELRSNSLK